jgi:gliding motility-associated-like protein
MKSFALTCYLIIFTFFDVFAQKENNVWPYGGGVGINFNTSPPSIVKTSMASNEGCAGICDPTGKLLFYSNGLKVWDNTNSVMPNGNDILGHKLLSSTQGVAILKVPDASSLYLLFTVDEIPDRYTRTGLLRYSVVDMSLNGGKGDIVAGKKNMILDSGKLSEKMLVAPGCNSLWLMTHHVDSPIFYSYKIYPGGLVASPVVSYTSGYSGYNMYSYGEIKISPDHKKIVMGNWASVRPSTIPVTNIDVVDFDYITGKVGTLYTIGESNGAYASEFSPDNSKLYVSDNVFPNGGLKQYDISLLPDVAAVRASMSLIKSYIYHGVRLGPDGKIYLFQRGAFRNVSVIHSPNTAGLSCNLEANYVPLDNTNSAVNYSFGHGTRIPDGTGAIFTSHKDTSMCPNSTIQLSVRPGFRSIVWSDGDTAATKIFNKSGVYWQYASNDCDTYIDTIKIVYKDLDTFAHAVKDTIICFDKEYKVLLEDADLTYRWNDGTTEPYTFFTGDAVKWVYSYNQYCQVFVDTFRVKFIDFNLAVPNRVICSDESIVLDATISAATSYQWSNGSVQPDIVVNEPGIYTIAVNLENCRKTASVLVTQKGFQVDLGQDELLCEGMTKQLMANIEGASYLWQDGSSNQSLTAMTQGKYSVEVKKDGCVASDTLEIKYEQCSNCLAIPNVFSPNHDGINDVFRPIFQCPVDKYALLIVNRYGQIIFQTNNSAVSWDGRFNNLEQELGTYYYLIKVKFDYADARELIYKGDISLLR